jgi:hypothetical protein
VHDAAPTALLHVPAGHARHAAAVSFMAPGVPNVPAAHGVPRHVKAPIDDEYVPGAHGAHVGPKVPAGHGAPTHTVDPGADVWPPAHGIHASPRW